jgi:signal transduction histidine kinase
MVADRSQFRSLRWRLLLSYLSIMAAILGSSAIAVYQVFASSVYTQLDDRLLTLADAAAHSLSTVKEHQEEELHEQAEAREENGEPSEPAPMDEDGDLDIPLQDIQRVDQGVEWFDEHQELLSRQGKVFPSSVRLNLRHLTEARSVDSGTIRTLTLTVYQHNEAGQALNLEGYVRVNALTHDVETVLAKLRWGLGLGGVLALGLTAFSGQWLTRQATRPIERSFQKLKQFTADASHELRSPLTAIKTSVEVMQSHPERIHPADVKKMMAIASATNQMTRLVEDLLLLARMDTTPDHISREWISIPLNELLEDLLDGFEIQAEEQDIALKADLPQIEPVMGDSAHLTRLFSTLLQNALHYTPPGGKVELTLQGDDDFAIISVQDTGIGIASEDLPFVFDRFWRADRARSQRSGGLGLGLAIAQSIAQQHGGDITVTSQPNSGTRFEVRLPLV